MPFARFDGLGPWIVRGAQPQLVTFGREYPDMVWLNWNAREIDRRLLSGLERPVWDSVAGALRAEITDAVIDSAIAEMPAAYVLANGGELRDALRARRQHLSAAAREYYGVLAREVDVRATDERDVARITRGLDGSVDVALWSRGDDARDDPWWHRRFTPDETREVRLFLNGADDRVLVRGVASHRILVRIIGGTGDDVVVDSVPGGDRALRYYDASGHDRFTTNGRGIIDRSPYTPPPVPRPENAVRDWGEWDYTQRTGSYETGIGLVAGLTHTRIRYGFRNDPFASRSILTADVSLTERRPRATWSWLLRDRSSSHALQVDVVASGLEIIRFHGLGNGTPSDQATAYYRVFQNLFRVAPALVTRVGDRATISLGAAIQRTATRDGTRTLVSETQPYGSGDFSEAGASLEVAVDRRDAPAWPTTGFRVLAGGSVHPAVLSVTSPFSEAHVTASTYVSAGGPLAPTLALRAGARHVWGAFPFHDAAFLGGGSSLRGWDRQRFAGRALEYGGAELRVRIGTISVVVPADAGVMGFADAGRVHADGDTSTTWHTGVGGGIWIAPLTRNNTISLAVARGAERLGIYLRSGFAF